MERNLMIQELVEAGEVIRRGNDFFEDMGGHIIHESQLDDYFDAYLRELTEIERNEVMERLRG